MELYSLGSLELKAHLPNETQLYLISILQNGEMVKCYKYLHFRPRRSRTRRSSFQQSLWATFAMSFLRLHLCLGQVACH